MTKITAMIYNSALAAWYCSGPRNPPPSPGQARAGNNSQYSVNYSRVTSPGCHAHPAAPGRGYIMEITLRDLPKVMGTQHFLGGTKAK